MSNYTEIIKKNLHRRYNSIPVDLAEKLPAQQVGDVFFFQAFGESCPIGPQGIKLGDKQYDAAITHAKRIAGPTDCMQINAF